MSGGWSVFQATGFRTTTSGSRSTMRRYRSGGSVITFARIARIPPSNIWNGSASTSTQSSSSRKRLLSCLLRERFLSTSSALRPRKACLAGCPMATTSSWVTTATTAATAEPGDSSRRETSSARSSTYSNDVHDGSSEGVSGEKIPPVPVLRSRIDGAPRLHGGRHLRGQPGLQQDHQVDAHGKIEGRAPEL